MADWESAERVQKNESGQFRAMIGGEWIPVAKAQKNASGQFRVMRVEQATPTPKVEWQAPPPSQSTLSELVSGAGNVAAGAVRGAGSIGATLLSPIDIVKDAIAGKGLSLESNRERRAAMTEALRMLGADPEALTFQAGKFGGELAGTAGTGGLLAKGAQGLGAAPRVVEALKTWGMGTGRVPANIGQRAADLAIRVPAGATVGGAAGLAIDPEHAGTGALVGGGAAAALPVVINPVIKAARWVKDVAKPTPGTLGVRAAGDKAQDVIQALQTQRSAVPGVNLNAGQASVPANSAEFAALQKLAAERHAPSLYFGPGGVKGQQEAARAAAVEGFAKTPADLERAITARTVASRQNYKDAFDQIIKRDPTLNTMWKNPYFKEEVGEAYKLFQAANVERKLQGLPTKTLKEDYTAFLHSVKEGLDAKLASATRPDAPAISNASKKAMSDAKDQLVTWLGDKNPLYDVARQTHIAMSTPINQMKAGQPMQRALVAPGTGKERATSFSNAVRAAETKMSKTTGRPQIEALTPAQRSVVDAINQDFARNAQYGELSQKGMASLQELVGAPKAPPTGFFEPIVSAARSWLNKILGTGHEAALDKLAPVMRDPKTMAALMQAATPQQRQAINAIIDKYMASGAVVASQDASP